MPEMVMGFLSDQGALGLASRLKVLSERCYDLVDQSYAEHGIGLQARWFPLLRVLQLRGPSTVGDIAREIGLTHSAVSQLANRLGRAGLLERGSGGDRRQRVLGLSAKAEAELKRARPLWQAMRAGVDARLQATGVDLLAALTRFEQGLDADPLPAEFGRRIRETAHAAEQVRIVPFAPLLRDHFYRLNAEWLAKYHSIEPFDHAVLSDPETHILGKGGQIWFARVGDEVVGTCALMPDAPGVWELTKMGVSERHQGLGLGRKLLAAAIAGFRELGGRELFLESSRKLTPALKLYESMGFQMQPGIKPGSHYSRADVYMIWRDPAAETA
jgi:DNA-binding MarR family transcriptional regulator/ribosomal protein S18 acetylase RimI-like enzyme